MFEIQDWIVKIILAWKCQSKLNWHFKLLETYIELIYTSVLIET